LCVIVFALWRECFDDVQVAQGNRSRAFQRAWNGQKRAPFAGKYQIDNVNRAVYRKQPGKKEVKPQALGKAKRYLEIVVKPLRKEFEQFVAGDLQAIDVVSPIDKQPAPHHHEKQREVDPMQPAYRERMFVFELLCHKGLKSKYILTVILRTKLFSPDWNRMDSASGSINASKLKRRPRIRVRSSDELNVRRKGNFI